MRTLLAAALVVLAGCAAPEPGQGPALRYRGEGCDEVGAVVEAPAGGVRALLPPGFAPLGPDGAAAGDVAMVVVAANACRFEVGGIPAEGPQAFVWVPVEPPAPLRLRPGAPHHFEVVQWWPPGPGFERLREALPGSAPARIAAPMPPRGGELAVAIEPLDGGALRIEGAAPGTGARDVAWPSQPCCRTLARGQEGLAAIDLASTGQPYGEGPCAVRTTLPALAAMLGGGERPATCGRFAPYGFAAEVRAAAPGPQR